MPNEVTEAMLHAAKAHLGDLCWDVEYGRNSDENIRKLYLAMRAADTPPVEEVEMVARAIAGVGYGEREFHPWDCLKEQEPEEAEFVREQARAAIAALTTPPVANTLTEGQLLSDKGVLGGDNFGCAICERPWNDHDPLCPNKGSLTVLRPHDEAVVEGGVFTGQDSGQYFPGKEQP